MQFGLSRRRRAGLNRFGGNSLKNVACSSISMGAQGIIQNAMFSSGFFVYGRKRLMDMGNSTREGGGKYGITRQQNSRF